MAVYAVGDIQGCYKQLRKLLKKVKFNAKKDTLWCVGDLVNRGPDSLKTLRFLKSLGDACVCVLGNHDLHLLERAAGCPAYRRDTLEAVLAAPDCQELIDWLRVQPLVYRDQRLGWTMVHAGMHPKWSLKKTLERAHAVEKELCGKHWKRFCRQLHGAKFPVKQPRKSEKMARRLFTVAVLTRTRYCTSDGRFNWRVRSGASRSYREKAWYAHRHLRWCKQTHLLFGHWAAKGLVTDQPHVLGLDSGAVWGNTLTLARLKKHGRFKIVAEV